MNYIAFGLVYLIGVITIPVAERALDWLEYKITGEHP